MRSGALTTAAWALEQGRGLHIVPGRLDDPAVAGCLAFLREAGPEAHVVAGVAELIEDLGLLDGGETRVEGGRRIRRRPRAVVAALSPPERAVARALAAGRASVDELVAATGQPGATVLGVLTALEVRGLAVETFGRYRPVGRWRSSGSGRGRRRRASGRCWRPGRRVTRDPRRRAPPARRGPRGCLVADRSVTLRATRQGAALGPSAPAVPLAAWLRWAAASGKWSHGGEVLRKVGATVLAVPVIVAFYVASLRGRGGAHRLLAALGAAAVVAIVAIASLPPAPSVAVPASVPTPVTAELLDAVRTGHPVTAPIQVKFDSPMDAASVAGALRVSPDSADQRHVGRGRPAADDRPDGALAARHAVHGHDRHERAVRAGRPPRQPGPRRRPRRPRPGPRPIAATQPRSRAMPVPTPRSRSISTVPSRWRRCRAALRTEPAIDGNARGRRDDRRLHVHPERGAPRPRRPTASRSRASSTRTACRSRRRPRSPYPRSMRPTGRPVPARSTRARRSIALRSSRSASRESMDHASTAKAFTRDRRRQARRRDHRLGREVARAGLPPVRRRSPTGRRSS